MTLLYTWNSIYLSKNKMNDPQISSFSPWTPVSWLPCKSWKKVNPVKSIHSSIHPSIHSPLILAYFIQGPMLHLEIQRRIVHGLCPQGGVRFLKVWGVWHASLGTLNWFAEHLRDEPKTVTVIYNLLCSNLTNKYYWGNLNNWHLHMIVTSIPLQDGL